MSSKQFQSSGGDVIVPSLKGLARTAPWLTLSEHDKVVYNTSSKFNGDESKAKVTLIAGGGSGHEPTHAGFVADGMLDAAVAGTIFASPSTKQISSGLEAVKSPKGSLIIVKNYTGDVIHFGLASERAKAHGNKVNVVIVGDDVSVGKTQGGLVGRRGLAATVLVHKLAGAAAANGASLDAVTAVAQAVVDNSVTMGASLDHCNVPGRKFESSLSANEYEIGMGIHNEPGVKKQSPLPTIPELVKDLLVYLLSTEDKERSFVPFKKTDKVILMINNLGGLSNLELLYATEAVHEELEKSYGIIPVRTVSGSFITALNGQGFSITLLNATSASAAGSTDVLELFDAPTKAIGWNSAAITSDWNLAPKDGTVKTAPSHEAKRSDKTYGISVDKDTVVKTLKAGIELVKKAEPNITAYDTYAGDGDCGETLVNGGNAIIKALDEGHIRFDDGVNTILDIAEIVEDSMGGTSGGLYCIYLSALALAIRDSGESSLNLATFAKSVRPALESLYKYTKARVGDRTLIDALTPFVDVLSAGKSFADAVKASDDGANSTRKLDAKFGRASYVSKEELRRFDSEGGLPDPGAVGLAELLKGFLSAL